MAGVRQTASFLARRRVRTVLCIGSPPAAWLGPGYRLPAEYHAAFARLWGAAVRAHAAAGVRPAYVELYNEPDGSWGIHIEPADNASVVRLVRAELDARGFRDVGICGPGTAHADWGAAGDQYVNAIDAATLPALAAWSNHAWEWDLAAINGEPGPRYLAAAWPSVLQAVRRKDPNSTRPVIVTEFATKASAFHGRAYRDQGAGPSESCASDTQAYAARVVQNALHLLNGGANALIVWEGADQPWSQHEWGLMTRPGHGSAPRPVYRALAAVFRLVRPGARVLPPAGPAGDVTATGFLQGGRMAIAVVNGSAQARTVRVEVAGVRALRLSAARSATGEAAVRPTVQGSALVCTVPSDGVVAVVCTVRR